MNNQNPHIGSSDPIKFIDTLIQAHEDDVLEILENTLHRLSSTEGKATLTDEELLPRIRGAISKIQGKTIDKEIDTALDELT